jgi:hypothetical protein
MNNVQKFCYMSANLKEETTLNQLSVEICFHATVCQHSQCDKNASEDL